MCLPAHLHIYLPSKGEIPRGSAISQINASRRGAMKQKDTARCFYAHPIMCTLGKQQHKHVWKGHTCLFRLVGRSYLSRVEQIFQRGDSGPYRSNRPDNASETLHLEALQ